MQQHKESPRPNLNRREFLVSAGVGLAYLFSGRLRRRFVPTESLNQQKKDSVPIVQAAGYIKAPARFMDSYFSVQRGLTPVSEVERSPEVYGALLTSDSPFDPQSGFSELDISIELFDAAPLQTCLATVRKNIDILNKSGLTVDASAIASQVNRVVYTYLKYSRSASADRKDLSFAERLDMRITNCQEYAALVTIVLAKLDIRSDLLYIAYRNSKIETKAHVISVIDDGEGHAVAVDGTILDAKYLTDYLREIEDDTAGIVQLKYDSVFAYPKNESGLPWDNASWLEAGKKKLGMGVYTSSNPDSPSLGASTDFGPHKNQ